MFLFILSLKIHKRKNKKAHSLFMIPRNFKVHCPEDAQITENVLLQSPDTIAKMIHFTLLNCNFA